MCNCVLAWVRSYAQRRYGADRYVHSHLTHHMLTGMGMVITFVSFFNLVSVMCVYV